MKRKPRTSGRIFSNPQYFGDMILVGIHKTKKLAKKKIEARKYRIDKSRIIKTPKGYKVFVHYK